MIIPRSAGGEGRYHREMPRRARVALDIRSLTDRVEIFRLAKGAKRDPAVERWLNDEPVELRSIAREWFTLMRRCGADVRELMHDGCPVACVEDAPFCYVNTFKSHVNIGFFYGALLEDPAGLLEGSGKRMRHAKLKPAADCDTQSLRKLIDAAYADIKTRLAE
jgi:hypothetical protein